MILVMGFGYAALVLASLLCAGFYVEQVLVRGSARARLAAWVWIYPTALWVIAFLFALLYASLPGGDLVHMFWSVQVPMVGSFLCSGVFLSETWSHRHGAWSGGSAPALRPVPRLDPWWRPRGPWAWMTMIALLALVPLFVRTVFADRYVDVTAPGGPAAVLGQLIEWGLGAERPAFLEPVNASQLERGMGHPQRDVTVTLGPLLIAAWLWIAGIAIALVGRLVPWPRLRTVFYVAAPGAVGCAALALGPGPYSWIPAWFDVAFFLPRTRSGIWQSTEPVLKSFGPMLFAALTAAALLFLAQRIERTRSQ